MPKSVWGHRDTAVNKTTKTGLFRTQDKRGRSLHVSACEVRGLFAVGRRKESQEARSGFTTSRTFSTERCRDILICQKATS